MIEEMLINQQVPSTIFDNSGTHSFSLTMIDELAQLVKSPPINITRSSEPPTLDGTDVQFGSLDSTLEELTEPQRPLSPTSQLTAQQQAEAPTVRISKLGFQFLMVTFLNLPLGGKFKKVTIKIGNPTITRPLRFHGDGELFLK